MKKLNLNKKIACLISLAMTSLIAFGTAMTAAAYVVIERHNQTITVDLDYSGYFDKLAGNPTGEYGKTETNPYVINNPTQLHNLSWMVNTGLFTNKDYFALGQTFDFATNNPHGALTPIGNFYTPFSSNFDGKDFVIKNLEVVGSELADVGMFGFVSADGIIKNFGLENPTVKSIRNAGFAGVYDYAHKDRNPLRTKISEEECKAVDIQIDTTGAPTVPNTNPVQLQGFKSFTLTLPTLADTSVQLYAKLSDPTMFTVDEVTHKYTLSTTYTVAKYVTLEVYGVTGVTLEDGTNRLSKMILERFKFWCNYDEKDAANSRYIMANPGDPKIYKKMIHKGYDEVISPAGSKERHIFDYVSHSLYAGIVCGNLEGYADRIYAKNPTLQVVGGPFQSNSYLIGRQIDDDNKSALSKESLDVSKVNKLVKADQLENKGSDGSGHYPSCGNRYFNNLYNDNVEGLFTIDAENTIKIYGTNGTKTGSSFNAKDHVKLNKVTVKNDDTDPDAPKTLQTNAISFDDNIYTKLIFQEGFIFKGYPRMKISNGIQFYATSTNNKNFFTKLLEGNGGKFHLSFEMDYLLFDDAYTPNYTPTTQIKMFGANKIEIEKSSHWHYQDPLSHKSDAVTGDLADVDVITNGNSIEEVKNSNQFYHSGIVLNDQDGKNPLTFSANEVNGTLSDINTNTTGHEIKTKKFMIETEIQPREGGFFNSFANYTPFFVFGFDNSANPNVNYRFDLLRLRILISNKNGNFSGTLLNVDFTNANIANNISSITESDLSRYRVETSLFNKTFSVDTASGGTVAPSDIIPFGIHPLVAGGNGCGTYTIKVTRSGKKINVTYNLNPSINISTDEDRKILPHAPDGFPSFTPTAY